MAKEAAANANNTKVTVVIFDPQTLVAALDIRDTSYTLHILLFISDIILRIGTYTYISDSHVYIYR